MAAVQPEPWLRALITTTTTTTNNNNNTLILVFGLFNVSQNGIVVVMFT
jgi:hypothetical protein